MTSIEPRLPPALPQDDVLIPLRDKWIAAGLSTAPADRARAEAAVRHAYRRAGRSDAVRMIWALSPMAGAHITDSLTRRAKVPRAVADVVTPLRRVVTRRASSVVSDAVSLYVATMLAQPVEAEVGAPVWAPINQQMARLIKHPIPVPAYGQHDARWLAYYEGLGELGVDVSELDALMEMAQSCGWWWPFDDVCVLTERYSRLARDARGRLHASDGPAVVYPDGWSIYAWRGTVVPDEIILWPELLTVLRIQRQPNVEVRRALLERYGLDRYIDDSGAIPIHADETGTLYRCEMAGDEPLVVVSVQNHTPEADGSRKRHVLRVPPDVTEARQAIAWTFGVRAEEYRPERET